MASGPPCELACSTKGGDLFALEVEVGEACGPRAGQPLEDGNDEPRILGDRDASRMVRVGHGLLDRVAFEGVLRFGHVERDRVQGDPERREKGGHLGHLAWVRGAYEHALGTVVGRSGNERQETRRTSPLPGRGPTTTMGG